MPTTERFIVSAKDQKLRKCNDIKSTDLIIEVFGNSHKSDAKEIYEALKNAGIENKYFSIAIHPK